MIRINLLPFRNVRQKENIRQQATVFLLLLILVTIPVLWYNSRLNGRIEALEGQIDYTRKDIAKFKKIAAEADELKKKIALIKTKLKIIENLEKSQKTAFLLMDTMTGMAVEKKKWFSRLEAMERAVQAPAPKKGKGGDKKGKKTEGANDDIPAAAARRPEIDVKIDGMALDDPTVADFMTRLETADLFTNIKLINLKQETFKQGQGRDDISLRNFQVSCKGVPEKTEAKKDPS